jgi:hypothetical protein
LTWTSKKTKQDQNQGQRAGAPALHDGYRGKIDG